MGHRDVRACAGGAGRCTFVAPGASRLNRCKQGAINDLEQKEQQLRASQLSALHIVWVHVAESNLPPSDLQLTIANCVISRKTGVPCVVIKVGASIETRCIY